MKTNRIKLILFHLSLWMLIVCLSGCDKEEVMYISPSVQIESAIATKLSTYEVVVRFDTGEGQEIESVELVFDDITVLSNPEFIEKINLKGDQTQVDTIRLTTNRMNHDYSVYARVKTEKYIYKSDAVVIRSHKNNFDISIYPDQEYHELQNNIADVVNAGDRFSLFVEYENNYTPELVEVKLNGNIEVNHELDFDNYWYGDNIETMGSVFIPDDLPPGTYEVFVYLDGIEFKTQHNIKVLKGNWKTIDPNYDGEVRGEYSCFVKGDDLFLIGGVFYVTQLDKSPVWKYNIKNNTWVQKSNFPHPGDVSKNKIFSFNLQYNNQAYIVLKNDEFIEIWKYRDEDDEWDFITKYPGKAIENLSCFITNGNLYLGGGSMINDIFDYDPTYDFWAYNLDADTWVQKKDMPIKPYGFNGNLSCITEQDQVFVFSYTNEMWQYYPETDQWIPRKEFTGRRRYISNLIAKDGSLYLIAGSYSDYGLVGLKDCWKYSIETDQWEIVAFLPELCAHGIAFTHENYIYTGLGWVVHGYGSYYDQNLYQLDL